MAGVTETVLIIKVQSETSNETRTGMVILRSDIAEVHLNLKQEQKVALQGLQT